jgi:hypothetical protein
MFESEPNTLNLEVLRHAEDASFPGIPEVDIILPLHLVNLRDTVFSDHFCCDGPKFRAPVLYKVVGRFYGIRSQTDRGFEDELNPLIRRSRKPLVMIGFRGEKQLGWVLLNQVLLLIGGFDLLDLFIRVIAGFDLDVG